MTEQLNIGSLSFEIKRSLRRKNVSLTVDRSGDLVIHSPASVTTDELSQWTESKLLWVYRKLALREEMAPQVNEPEYVTGERFGYLGRTYRLMIVREQSEPLHFDGSCFRLREDARGTAIEQFRRWYITRGAEWIKVRAERLAPKAGVTFGSIEIRDLGFRWGSCGKHQVLYFNWKALQLPVRLLDYLLLHELAHIAVHNHSPAFWSILDRALPDWEQRKAELLVKAKDLFWLGEMKGA